MQEKDFYPKIGKYYERTAQTSLPIEIKITKTNRLAFSSVPPHQERHLTRRWSYKIPDTGKGQKPVDIIVMTEPGYLVIVYYRPRASVIIEIPAHVFIEEKYKSGNKSLHIDRAREIGREISP